MRTSILITVFAMLCCLRAPAQTQPGVSVHVHIASADPAHSSHRPAVVWLDAIGARLPFPRKPHYTLLQKDRSFQPHVQVVPVNSVVNFPNADPFLHNVFSMYEGKRFDLGLYEAGSTRSVTFSRPGVSYIFCNIHPEMSAVILALESPLYVITSLNSEASIASVPSGDYTLHVWVEGVPQATLDDLSRRIHVGSVPVELAQITVPSSSGPQVPHLNKFGKPYKPAPKETY